jgi:molybdate transport system ATP-binding protein
MLELAVKRRQGDFQLDVELAAGAGVTALFGRSGSGKSSVVNMVAGLYRPDCGRIKVDGRVLFDAAARIDLPPEKRRLGTVFQDARLFPHLDVRTNLEFGMRRVAPADRKVAFADVVEILGVGALLDRRPATLSGGERQRVAIGRALLASPRILLMDEPLAALDNARKSELLPFIGRLARRFAIPILYVSHAIDEVLRLADTLVIMDAGRAAVVGPVEEVLSRPDLRPLTGRYEAGAVLAAIVAGHDPTYGLSTLTFPGGTLVAGRIDLPVGTHVRVRIHARDITIAVDRPERVSTRNLLPAVVREVRPVQNYVVDVVLDVGGTPLWAQITALSQAQLGLAPGMRVHALLKAINIARGDVADRG